MLTRIATRVAYELTSYVARSNSEYCPATQRRLALLGGQWSELVRKPVLSSLIENTEGRVSSGPFSGLQMPKSANWGDGDLLAKLLGVYEKEVLAALETLSGQSFDAVINVGCADGYYAVGLTKLFAPKCTYAADIDRYAVQNCVALAELNNCSGQLKTIEVLKPEQLVDLAIRHPNSLIVCDCEGYEDELFTPEVLEALRTSTLIIECHEAIIPDCVPELTRRVEDTHTVELMVEGPRDPNQFYNLRHLSSLERWAALSEGRSEMGTWLFARPKTSLCRPN